MKNVSINDAVKVVLNLKGKDKVSMIGIGPMSLPLIKASLLLAKEKDFPLMFIASRNQVDSKELGGGYVCNWDQKGFTNAIKDIAKEINFEGLYYLCRDHGGPWQRDNERNAHLEEEEAMKLGKQSYLEDLINGFDLLHIDPTKDPYVVGKVISMETVINRTIELIEYVENERKERNLSAIGYEIGTEETNGGLTSAESYEKFIRLITEKLNEKGLPTPAFIVGQTGTLTRLTENVGDFSGENAKQLAGIAFKYNVGLKEHNGDYLKDEFILQHPSLGITGMNVAPEFGQVETKAYLNLIKVEEEVFHQGLINSKSQLKTVLKEESVKTERWRKWMVGDNKDISVEEVLKNSELSSYITEIGGHYTFNNDRVKEETKNLFDNLSNVGINAEKYVLDIIKDSMDRYVKCFNLEGLTTKIREAL